jgi:branched-chain amino acid transport system substrate-binding protein
MKKKLIIWILLSVLVVLAISLWQINKKSSDLRIGAILPLTGDAASYGESLKKGIDMAVEEINKDGGIHGKKVAVIYEDSRALPSEGVSALQTLISIYNVQAVIGDAVSSVTLAIAPIAEKHKVVILSPLSSAPAITNAGDYIFRNVPSDFFGGKVAAHFAVRDQDWKSLAVLFINNDFGDALKQVFCDEAKRLGGHILAAESYSQNATDFRTQLTKIKSVNPQTVFLVGYREVSQILVQAKELDLKSQFLGTGLLEDPRILKTIVDTGAQVYFTQLPYSPESADPIVKTFVDGHKKRYDSMPDIISAYGFDAATVLSYAISKSDLSGTGIKDQLYKVRDFHGVTGSITFDANGDVIQPMGVKFVQNGQFAWFKREISIQ